MKFFQFIHKQKDSTTNPTATIIFQTLASLEVDGYVRFKNLGISHSVDNFEIQYSFIKPEGVNA